jgi:MFS superfamily sulfate permease-like transporter
MIIGIAVIVPLVILLLIALTAGIAVAAVVACILTLRNVARRLIHPGRPAALARRDVFSARDVIVVERVDVPGSQVNH